MTSNHTAVAVSPKNGSTYVNVYVWCPAVRREITKDAAPNCSCVRHGACDDSTSGPSRIVTDALEYGLSACTLTTILAEPPSIGCAVVATARIRGAGQPARLISRPSPLNVRRSVWPSCAIGNIAGDALTCKPSTRSNVPFP